MKYIRLSLLVLGLAFATAAPAQTPSPQKSPITLKEIGPGVYAAISGSNAGFIVGDDGVLVEDCFIEHGTAKAMLGEIRKITPMSIRYVVITHYHSENVSCDQVFNDAVAIIITH